VSAIAARLFLFLLFPFPNSVTVYGPGGKDACVFGEDFSDDGLQERGDTIVQGTAIKNLVSADYKVMPLRMRRTRI